MVLSIIIINETIRAKLIIFIALFADLAAIAIAYDNAPHARSPVEWQFPKIWFISAILGLLLASGTWILRVTLFWTMEELFKTLVIRKKFSSWRFP